MAMLAAPSFVELPLLEQAILKTLAYGDVFQYPLKAAEIERYLIELPADAAAVRRALRPGGPLAGWLSKDQGLYALPGREAVFARRRERAALAEALWLRTRSYGSRIAGLPFVRMVAVTGALAMDNEAGRDLDYLIVTAPGRLWVCRALIILLVRWAQRRGDTICPNYLITENALAFDERNLYTAHELAQMVPLAGMGVYAELRRVNAWTATYLPNAGGPPPHAQPGEVRPVPARRPGWQRLVEATLRTAPGGWLEAWEMDRKVRRLGRQAGGNPEAAFSADWCKGHFGGYGQMTLARYAERLAALMEPV